MDDVTNKLDAIAEKIHGILVTQAEMRGDLREHMRRTDAAEKNGMRLEALIVTTKEGLERKVRPLQKHVDRVQYLFVFVVGAGALAGAAKAVLEAIIYMRGVR